MTLKELQKHYYIYKRGHEYRICSLTEHGRSPHKYLCSAVKNGNKMSVIGYGLTSNVDTFKEQVKDYLSKLEYDSEYFNPDFRKGLKEELFVHDYLDKLGFRSQGDSLYVYSQKDIYGGKSFSIKLSFYNLDVMKFWDKPDIPETSDINLWIHSMSRVNAKVPRTFEGLKKGIDGLLKPLLLSESLSLVEMSEQMECGEVDLKQISMSGLNITTSDFKVTLKQRLEEILKTL